MCSILKDRVSHMVVSFLSIADSSLLALTVLCIEIPLNGG